METVNQAVVATRAVLDRIDSRFLGQVLKGEAHVIDGHQMALQAPRPASECDALSTLRAEMPSLVAGMKVRA